MEYSFSNVAREMEVYGYDRVVKSHCRNCHGGCGVLVYVKDGRVAKIAGGSGLPHQPRHALAAEDWPRRNWFTIPTGSPIR